MRRAAVLLLLLCLLPFAATACGGDDDSDTTTEAAATTTEASTTTTGGTSAVECKDVEAPKAAERSADKPSGDFDTSKTYKLTMETSCGSFTITLDPEQSPNTVQSVVSLAQDGFYDDTVFHRILPGFVIQGGDPTATGGGGPGYSTVDMPPTDATYPHGTVAMAKSGDEPAGTAGSQFFVVTSADSAPLTPDYAIIGTVTEGLDVVDKIGEYGPANDPTGVGAPTKVITIEKATVTES